MKIDVNFEKKIAPIRAMHGVGQPPRLGISDEYMHYLTDANIPYARLHDVGGLFGGNLYVDIPNIFRDFQADETDPANYDFAFTDLLIKQICDAKCEPIFRLGVSIEGYQHIRAYRIFPPADFEKWARICERIVMHYNEGWANGFEYGIRYWEIWNEPDNLGPEIQNNHMWKGTMQDYFDLYEVTAKRLKCHFGDSIKIGGPASCGFYALFGEEPTPSSLYYMEFAEKFLDFCVQSHSPLDFFSWHSYADIDCTGKMADFVDQMLTKRGLGDLETQLNEWNNCAENRSLRGTATAAAAAAAMMLAMQKKKTTTLCYYDARIGQSIYGGMFNPINYTPFPLYYSFQAFGELYALGSQVEMSDTPGFYAIAATDGEKKAVMLANISDDVELESDLVGFRVRAVDASHELTEIEANPTKLTLAKDQVLLLTND